MTVDEPSSGVETKVEFASPVVGGRVGKTSYVKLVVAVVSVTALVGL